MTELHNDHAQIANNEGAYIPMENVDAALRRMKDAVDELWQQGAKCRMALSSLQYSSAGSARGWGCPRGQTYEPNGRPGGREADDVGRPLSVQSVVVYWLMDSIIYDLEALKAKRDGDGAKEVRCILMAITAKKLALGRIEGLDGQAPKPSGVKGGSSQ